MLIDTYRTLYQTLNVFDPGLRGVFRPKEKITPENPLGTPADTQAYTLGCDIDKGHGCNIEDFETKQAVDAAAQFLVADLKRNGIHDSVWVLFSGGGIYVHIHHGICQPGTIEGRDEFLEMVTDCFNGYIAHISEEFFSIHPECKGKVKYDALNNSKRIFKCILSIHKSKPYAVTPLDRDAIRIDFERARVPLKPDMIEEARNWYSTYDPAERVPLLKLLDQFQIPKEERKKRSDKDSKEPFAFAVKIDCKDFPPCIKHIIDTTNTGGGKTRFSAVLSTFLFQAGWSEDEAWEVVKTVSERNGLDNAHHIFDSCFGRISCPSCKTIQNDEAGYPHLGLKGLGACKPDEKCDRWPGDYGLIHFLSRMVPKAKEQPDGEITETEIEAYSLPEGPKFECRLPKDNFIQTFSEYGTDLSDAYGEYWIAGGLFALAVVADKKIKISLKQGVIYPNLYISINGKSSLARKSTVVDMTENQLCEVLQGLRSALVPTEFSPEAFTEHLSDFNHAPWIRDEAAGVLGLMKKDYMRGFKDSLMQLYDCKPFYRKLRTSQRKNTKTEFRVDDPYLNLLWATTDASLGANTEQNDTLSGFMARFLFFFPQGKKSKWLPLEEGTAANSIFEGVVRNQLAEIAAKMAALPGCTALHFSPEAAAYYTEWQRVREEEWTASNDGNAMQIYSRLAPTVVKLSMLFELASPDFDVSKPIRREFMEEACRLVDDYFMPTARAVYELVGSNAEKNRLDRIAAYLKRNSGKALTRDILRSTRMTKKEFDEAIEAMEESGEIEIRIEKPGSSGGRPRKWALLSSVSLVSNVSLVGLVNKVNRDKSHENGGNLWDKTDKTDRTDKTDKIDEIPLDKLEREKINNDDPQQAGMPKLARDEAFIRPHPQAEVLPSRDCGNCQVAKCGDRSAIKCDPCSYLKKAEA
jgi:hypothetical protein